jgi:hypothetical protein
MSAAVSSAHVEPPCLRAAAWYARRWGLRVHPLRPSTKFPALLGWQRQATTDQATIGRWWKERPAAGVGIATGAESGVIALDVDPRNGGNESLERIQVEQGELPATWTAQTPSGGRHYYYRHPGGHVGNRVGIRPGLDLRGDGGFVVAPPTELDRDRGYIWETERAPTEIGLADPPSWLIERPAVSDRQARPLDEWIALVRDGAREGYRNDAAAKLTGYLLRCRPAPRVVFELVRVWNERRCFPPLPEDEITRTVDSIARREAERTAGRSAR